jgi:hypothetical protein
MGKNIQNRGHVLDYTQYKKVHGTHRMNPFTLVTEKMLLLSLHVFTD